MNRALVPRPRTIVVTFSVLSAAPTCVENPKSRSAATAPPDPADANAVAGPLNRASGPVVEVDPDAGEAPAEVEDRPGPHVGSQDAGCPDPESLALEWAKTKWPDSSFTRARFERDEMNAIDLDRDDTPDVTLVYGGGTRNNHHLVFWIAEGCARLVAEVSASPLFGVHCSSTSHNGLCDIRASQMMIHGEAQHSTYAFDGTKYVLVPGSIELGPRRTFKGSKGRP